jgi:MraZ protein
VNIIEIWDRSSYEKAIADSRDDFAKLAEEVMGGDEEYLSFTGITGGVN